MELNSEIPTLPPRDAATVVLLRDGAQGLEVFLVKRHGLSDVLGGAYVFPGGKLDAADCDAAHHAHFDRDAATKNYVIGQVDSRGGAGADGGQQPVAPPEHLTDAVGTTGVGHRTRLVL